MDPQGGSPPAPFHFPKDVADELPAHLYAWSVAALHCWGSIYLRFCRVTSERHLPVDTLTKFCVVIPADKIGVLAGFIVAGRVRVYPSEYDRRATPGFTRVARHFFARRFPVFHPQLKPHGVTPMNIIPLSIIIRPERQRQEFDPDALQELKVSIEDRGLLHPPVLRRDGDSWVLVAGERRLKAISEIF